MVSRALSPVVVEDRVVCDVVELVSVVWVNVDVVTVVSVCVRVVTVVAVSSRGWGSAGRGLARSPRLRSWRWAAVVEVVAVVAVSV